MGEIERGGGGVQLVLSGDLGGTARPFMPHPWLFTRPMNVRQDHTFLPIRTPLSVPQQHKVEMKMSSGSMGASKRRLSSRGVGGVLREQRAKLYIIRRCVVMLLCWHD
ncbi:hypothetical protein GOBAR_AA33514 [Gossypium barbadense]|uniref:ROTUNDIFOLIA like 8 n=3 Tax=Gossypium TaxID=3633 RepID=A0A2P5W7Y7_GOSBA|nr:hypothetical protein GOBAR_AA33514 [Gossypium barbadense]